METARSSAEMKSTPSPAVFFKSIQARLLILLLIVIIPVIAVQISTYRHRFKDRRLVEIQGNLEIAQSVARRFHSFIEDILSHESVAGRMLLSSHWRTPEKMELIKGMASISPTVSHMHWINPQGRIIASSFPEAMGHDRRAWPFFRDILSGKEWVLSDLYRSELTGAPVFCVSRGIRNEEGALAGIVVTVILADRLNEMLKIERPRKGALVLIDRQGRRVFQYPKGGQIWEKRHIWNNLPLIQAALAGKEATGTVDEPNDQVRKIVALSPIRPLGWVAGASRPEEEVMASIFSNLVNQSILFLVVVIGAFLAALAFSRNISVPMKRLREQALALGGGDLGWRVRITGPAEVEDLGRTMNLMAEELSKTKAQMLENADRIMKQREELREANEQLEVRVRVRTTKLLKLNDQLREEIKERQAKEKAYKQLSHKNELILNTAEEGIFGVDPKGMITFVNPTAARLMGREIEELLNQPIHELSHHSGSEGNPIPWEECGVCRSYNEGVTYYNTADEQFLRKDGTFFPIEYSSSPIWEEGGLEGAVVVFRDITERKAAEESLKVSEERLKYLSSELLVTQERERREIAKELHDSIGSTLSAVKFKVESILAPEKEDTALYASLNPLVSLIQNAIKEVRRICQNLRPAILDDLGLMVTLSWFCREFESTYPISVQIQTDIKENDVPEPLKIVIFRIMQEAMNNSAKYSRADQITLRLMKKEETIELDIEDNGQGFDLEEVASRTGSQKGLGLISMKERAELSGGTFNLRSTVGSGTGIKAVWPV